MYNFVSHAANTAIELLEKAGALISLIAVAIIFIGFIVAITLHLGRLRKVDTLDNFSQFKVDLGRLLTLGLEILVVADVIETITVKPTFNSLAVLAFIVVIRTIVNWTLILETEGRWPWQQENGGNENG